MNAEYELFKRQNGQPDIISQGENTQGENTQEENTDVNETKVAEAKDEIKQATQEYEEGEAEAKEAGTTDMVADAKIEQAANKMERRFTSAEIKQAIEELQDENYEFSMMHRLLSGNYKEYEIERGDIEKLLSVPGLEFDGDFNELAEVLQGIAERGATMPSVHAIKGFQDSFAKDTAKKKLKKMLREIELDGDIGYKLDDDDDDISFFDSDDFNKSKYGEVLRKLNSNGLSNLGQYEFAKDKIRSLLNEGIVPKDIVVSKESIISPTAKETNVIATQKDISQMSPEEVKKCAMKFLSAGDRAGFEKFKRELINA